MFYTEMLGIIFLASVRYDDKNIEYRLKVARNSFQHLYFDELI